MMITAQCPSINVLVFFQLPFFGLFSRVSFLYDQGQIMKLLHHFNSQLSRHMMQIFQLMFLQLPSAALISCAGMNIPSFVRT